jgi:hypothetical protein
MDLNGKHTDFIAAPQSCMGNTIVPFTAENRQTWHFSVRLPLGASRLPSFPSMAAPTPRVVVAAAGSPTLLLLVQRPPPPPGFCCGHALDCRRCCAPPSAAHCRLRLKEAAPSDLGVAIVRKASRLSSMRLPRGEGGRRGQEREREEGGARPVDREEHSLPVGRRRCMCADTGGAPALRIVVVVVGALCSILVPPPNLSDTRGKRAIGTSIYVYEIAAIVGHYSPLRLSVLLSPVVAPPLPSHPPPLGQK